MYDALERELTTYEKRTPKSAAAHKRALERIPLGVASNYRHYEPYPIFVRDGKAGRIHDVDGNEYVDHNLCFGALMAGHCHPAVVKSANAIPSRWFASAPAVPKFPCTLFASRGPPPGATKSSNSKAPITAFTML